MEGKIINYLKLVNLKIFGERLGFQILSISRLGLGESNLNYLIHTSRKNILFRINIDPYSPEKTQREFLALSLAPSEITPNVFHYESANEYLGSLFIVLEFLEGISLDKVEIKDEYIVKLAHLVGNLHNTKLSHEMEKKLQKYRFSDLLNKIQDRMDYLNSKIRNHSNPLLKLLEITNASI